mgnify:CR=1 FL=1
MAQSRPEDIEYRSSRLKRFTEYQYTTTEHAIEDVSEHNYFKNMAQNWFAPGDTIHISVIHEVEDKVDSGNSGFPDPLSWSRVGFEVVSVDEHDIVLKQLGEWGHTNYAPPKKRVSKPRAVA